MSVSSAPAGEVELLRGALHPVEARQHLQPRRGIAESPLACCQSCSCACLAALCLLTAHQKNRSDDPHSQPNKPPRSQQHASRIMRIIASLSRAPRSCSRSGCGTWSSPGPCSPRWRSRERSGPPCWRWRRTPGPSGRASGRPRAPAPAGGDLLMRRVMHEQLVVKITAPALMRHARIPAHAVG